MRNYCNQGDSAQNPSRSILSVIAIFRQLTLLPLNWFVAWLWKRPSVSRCWMGIQEPGIGVFWLRWTWMLPRRITRFVFAQRRSARTHRTDMPVCICTSQ